MIIDSSAIVAVAFDEPTRPQIVRALLSSAQNQVSAPVWLETSIVLFASGMAQAEAFLDSFADRFRVDVAAFTPEHSRVALAAWRQYGRGNHPARLNFGDCMSYAAAKVARDSLLFVGDDFGLTDLDSGLG